MKFKVEKGTETYRRLELLQERINECNNEALNLVESLGFKKFGVSNSGRGGGISCVKADDKPDGFKVVGKPHQNLFMPKSSNKKLWDKINALPIVSYQEFNDVIGFTPHFKGLSHYRSYGFERLDDLFLVDVGDADYTPKEDMIEILDSEYKKLLEQNVF